MLYQQNAPMATVNLNIQQECVSSLVNAITSYSNTVTLKCDLSWPSPPMNFACGADSKQGKSFYFPSLLSAPHTLHRTVQLLSEQALEGPQPHTAQTPKGRATHIAPVHTSGAPQPAAGAIFHTTTAP